MNVYRVTRKWPYRDSIGATNLSARQGYYIEAANEQHALCLMAVNHPDDIKLLPNDCPFDVQFWSKAK